MHGLWRVREHMPEAGDHHAAGRGGIFLYPKVDGEKCVSCDLCEKRCPAGREMPERPAYLFGVQAKDEALRGQSSSGGVFTLLAREVIRQGGVVFGAAFDEVLHVEHIGAFDESELSGMRTRTL